MPTPDEFNAAIERLVQQNPQKSREELTQELLQGLGEPGQGAQSSWFSRTIAEPVTKAVAKGFEVAGDTGLSPHSLKEPSEAIAKFLVPQSGTELAVQAATGVMGVGGKAALLAPPVVGAAVGAMEGGEEGALTGAGMGLLSTFLGSAGKLLRQTQGSKILQPDDVTRVTQAAHRAASDVLPAKTPSSGRAAVQAVEEFKQLVGQRGNEMAGQAFRNRVQGAIAATGQHNPVITSPTYNRLHGLQPNAAVSAHDVVEFITDRHLQNRVRLPSGAERTGISSRDLALHLETIRDELGQSLGWYAPGAKTLYQAANREYAAFKGLQKLFSTPGVIERNSFNMVKLGQILETPSDVVLNLERRLGRQNFEALKQAVFRGSTQTLADQMGTLRLPIVGTLIGGRMRAGVSADRLLDVALPRFTGTRQSLRQLGQGMPESLSSLAGLKSLSELARGEEP